MNVLVAMDSFKGSCTACACGEAVKRGILRAISDATVVNLPVADGGEGTVAALLEAKRARPERCMVTGPFGKRTEAVWAVMQDSIAVLEMSAASGILLAEPSELNPCTATTYGTGEMIRDALDKGYRRFVLGLGGSATNDGGAGMLQALGVSLRDAEGHELPPGGAALSRLAVIDASALDARIAECSFTLASDVRNPLCGPQGASAVFGPQKGADERMVAQLDAALLNFAECIKVQRGCDVAGLAGAGAAGGMGAAALAFLNAGFRQGIEVMLDLLDFDQQARSASLVITGEGRIDGQTAFGKVPAGVARRVKALGCTPVIALAGCVGSGAEAVYDCGVDAWFCIADRPMTLSESMSRVQELLSTFAENLMRSVLALRVSTREAREEIAK